MHLSLAVISVQYWNNARQDNNLAALPLLKNCRGMVSGVPRLMGFTGFDLCLFVRDKGPSQRRAGGSFSAFVTARERHWGLSA